MKDRQHHRLEVTFSDVNLARQLFGEHNGNLKRIANAIGAVINARGTTVLIEAEETTAELAKNILNQFYYLLKQKFPLHPNDIDLAVRAFKADPKLKLKDIFLETIFITSKKRAVTPKNLTQKKYVEAIREFDIIFGIGPAGTGKTYLAMAMAVAALSKGEVNRLILTRPAVEAGESLGFLPGDLAEKVDPYLRPLYDALHDMLPFEKVSDLMEKNIIEVAPLAFMRGRTLNDSFIILDEAQNTTTEQMKMFLTRMGFNSKVVITGDITQTDLPKGKRSGLKEAKTILQDINGIQFVYFSQQDVVRHKLVMEIIKAYETIAEQAT